MGKARLFIAVDLPDEIRGKIYRVCAGIPAVRWTKQEQLHLTICFLGDTDLETLLPLAEALGQLKFKPFKLSISGTGIFRPGTFFLEINESTALLALKEQIEGVLYNILELEPAGRSFVPHITLARFRKRPSAAKSRLLTQTFETLFPLSFEVGKFVLYRSKLNSDGAIHTALKEINAS